MISTVAEKASAGSGASLDNEAGRWDERLGWAYGLVADDPGERAAALTQLSNSHRKTSDAHDRMNEAWRRRLPLGRKRAAGNYYEALRHSLPGALWNRPPGTDIAAWPGLPYALLYLEWEARYPREWTQHAKAWGTKERLIRDLAVTHHDKSTRAKLAGLIEIVVQRPYRCKDHEYVRVARAVDSDDLRGRLNTAARTENPWARRHAGYILWLLDRPEVPHTRHVWRQWLTSECSEQVLPERPVGEPAEAAY
ncbi:hypothetical protein OG735_39370 [Streptomyces sp. NBC_01210]|uniref:hypothetical protein n=1 Tax=Streptomyces sp. NBC_01210 TaxID=2903774 RepID=UPI002E12A649|nr:hypothetical protein OG735_39370 [Streptomyces sp. NBC_01210]